MLSIIIDGCTGFLTANDVALRLLSDEEYSYITELTMNLKRRLDHEQE